MRARCGLAAVRTDELIRRSLFQAMKARRTYATSGIRAYVGFSINGHEMGTEFSVPSPTEPRLIDVAVAAPKRIVKLEVVRNGEIMVDLSDGNWFVEAEITDKQPIPAGVFYYLRATTERTDFAWSSHIWVNVSNGNKSGKPR